MAKKQKAYFGLDYIISLILVIIFPANWICSIIKRLQDGCPIAAIIRIFFAWNILWIADIVCMILKKDICCILNC